MITNKRYVSNLVLANIIITLVTILLSLNVIKNFKRDDMLFINSPIIIIDFVSLMCAYFGIIGVIHKNPCELNVYSILSPLLIVGEISLYLFITFMSARHDWNSYYSRVSASALSITALVMVLLQIWLLYETKVYQNLANDLDGDLGQKSTILFSLESNVRPMNDLYLSVSYPSLNSSPVCGILIEHFDSLNPLASSALPISISLTSIESNGSNQRRQSVPKETSV
jgi:hypothetical protein